MSKEAREQGFGREEVFHENDLKICGLCGWLNLEHNTECFVCGWRGHFEREPEVVRTAVELAVRRHGRLELQHLTDPATYRRPPAETLQSRFFQWLGRVWNWLRS